MSWPKISRPKWWWMMMMNPMGHESVKDHQPKTNLRFAEKKKIEDSPWKRWFENAIFLGIFESKKKSKLVRILDPRHVHPFFSTAREKITTPPSRLPSSPRLRSCTERRSPVPLFDRRSHQSGKNMSTPSTPKANQFFNGWKWVFPKIGVPPNHPF